VVIETSLKEGGQGTEFICLSKDVKTCYHVEAFGGTWGKEVSWDVRGYSEGSSSVAGGGSPMMCDFSVGEGCDTTCYGRPKDDPTKDPDYKEFKDMYQCIEKKCLIQVGACKKDDDCVHCLQEIIADSCHSVPTFNAVMDCTVCQCTDKKGSTYCMDKANPGIVIPGKNDAKPEGCTPGEVIKGGAALMGFGKCTDFDVVAVLVSNFDQNNFGDLDLFESCAHAFEAKKGEKTALDCLQILVDAKNGKAQDETSGKVVTDTVSALARLLYDDGQKFCDCSKRASEACPLCPSFLHFKTLLYESLDACMALDEIDCAAWEEFYTPCKKNLETLYTSIDFKDKGQCNFVKTGCGGAGPFPAFRQLDCYKEISSVSWDFHNDFVKACMKDGDAPTPTPPTPAAPTPVAPTPVAPTPTAPIAPPIPTPPYSPPTTPSDGSKPYVPPEDKDKKEKKEYTGDDDGKKSHWFRNLVLVSLIGGGAYYVYKRRSEGFSFNSYRSMPRYFGEEDMYSGLAMESSTNFEPPSLPPPPSAMGGSSYLGGSQYSAPYSAPYSQQ
jgi:hypothetical protein